MHLSPAQCTRFYRLYYALLDYVNETCDVLEEPFMPFDEEYGGEQIQELTNYTFDHHALDHRELIDRFIQDKHRSLSAADRTQVSQWKEALSGPFMLVEHTAAHSVFLSSACVFHVIGLSQNISSMVKGLPAPVDTVLLPFENHIVYGVNISQFPVEVGDNMRKTLEEERTKLKREGHVAISAEEFLREAPRCRQLDAEHEAQEEARRREEEASLDEPTPGLHAGALAGLTGDERKAAIRRHMDEHDEENAIQRRNRHWEPCCLHHAPVRSLKETLLAMRRDQLISLCKQYERTGYSKLKKAELVERLLPLVMCARYNPVELLGATHRISALELGKRAYHAGGMLQMSRSEHDALPAAQCMWPVSPILNVFLHGDMVTCVIPDELMAVIKDEDWEREEAKLAKLQHARHLAEAYLELCGLISFDELTEIYLRYYPTEYTREEFRDFLFHDGLDDYSHFDIWSYEGEPHIIGFDLLEEEYFNGTSSGVVINGDKMKDPTDEEYFRRYLHSRHAQVGAPAWEVPTKTAAELEAYEYLDHVESLPSVIALQSFLDAHVPDDWPNDYYFADRVIEDLITMAQYDYRPQEVIEALQDYGLVFDSIGKLNQMLTLVMNAMNDLPRWSNNGWSPSELMYRELRKGTGKKIFYDENGRPRKIGRNEPCPCGSGKKYKKCCGR